MLGHYLGQVKTSSWLHFHDEESHFGGAMGVESRRPPLVVPGGVFVGPPLLGEQSLATASWGTARGAHRTEREALLLTHQRSYHKFS